MCDAALGYLAVRRWNASAGITASVVSVCAQARAQVLRKARASLPAELDIEPCGKCDTRGIIRLGSLSGSFEATESDIDIDRVCCPPTSDELSGGMSASSYVKPSSTCSVNRRKIVNRELSVPPLFTSFTS